MSALFGGECVEVHTYDGVFTGVVHQADDEHLSIVLVSGEGDGPGHGETVLAPVLDVCMIVFDR